MVRCSFPCRMLGSFSLSTTSIPQFYYSLYFVAMYVSVCAQVAATESAPRYALAAQTHVLRRGSRGSRPTGSERHRLRLYDTAPLLATVGTCPICVRPSGDYGYWPHVLVWRRAESTPCPKTLEGAVTCSATGLYLGVV